MQSRIVTSPHVFTQLKIGTKIRSWLLVSSYPVHTTKYILPCRAGILLLALSLPGILSAQSVPTLQTMNEALKLRSDMAAAIVQGSEKPAAALTRLRGQASPSGLKTDAAADFGFAAIDMGHRLIAAGKPAEAELFFQAAEKSLMMFLRKTPDTEAQQKAQCLQQLAFIRGRYLNNPAQARADLEQAITLLPDDKTLQAARDHLASERAEHFKTQPKN